MALFYSAFHTWVHRGLKTLVKGLCENLVILIQKESFFNWSISLHGLESPQHCLHCSVPNMAGLT